MTFKALIINNEDDKFTKEVKQIDKTFLKHGNVLVKIDYSSLNYKDGMILKNGGSLVKEYPHIPGIDFAGTVEESDSDKFKKNDKVILTGWRVGEIYFGGYSQYAKVKDDFLVKMPDDLDSKKSMILGTAGLTALMCVLALQARETILLGEPIKDVLVTGATGGVGSVAVLALSKLGYNVAAVTGKSEKSDFLKSLGASTIIQRDDMNQDARPIDKGLYDGVVDTTGGKILAKALSHTKPNGIVAACGLASSFKLETTVMPFIIRGVKLWGIDSVTAPAKRREFLWSQASTYLDFEKLSVGVEEWSLEDLATYSSKILKGEISGRVIINVNK
ncbi:MAG: zinc-binding alcohol dehydrogenase [Candidatus Pelagibacter sp.]|nr:zinc-binding alcohol dehydrogenase [Candidatus Pelagibacter sp.]